MMRWIGSVAVLASALVLLGGLGKSCQQTNPEAAYLSGDLLTAREYYSKASCSEAPLEEAELCRQRAEEIQRSLIGASRYLAKRANSLTRHQRDIQYNRYSEAVRCLQLALKLLADDHPSREAFIGGMQRIRETMSSLERELIGQLGKLHELLEAGTYDPEVWTDIRLTFERVRILQLAIGSGDDRPWRLATEYVSKFHRHGQFEHARIAMQLAQAVLTGNNDGKRPLTDEELVLHGVIEYRAAQQERDRKRQIKTLMEEFRKRRRAKQDDLTIELAQKALRLGAGGHAARELRRILQRLQGPIGRAQRTKLARRTVAKAKAEVVPVAVPERPAGPAAGNPVPTAPVAATGAGQSTVEVGSPMALEDSATEAPPESIPFAQRLDQLVQQFENNETYDAIAGLEELLLETEKPLHQRRILAVRLIWTPDRKRLLEELVRQADRRFVAMDERSLEQYRQAQRLGPEGTLAEHIDERIDTIERIIAE